MSKSKIAALDNQLASARLITTDVFDTLLLRNLRAERTRIVMGERRFAALLAGNGIGVDADLLVEARLRAQVMAYRAADIGGTPWDVRLRDILSRQVRLAGLSADWAAIRFGIELDIETQSLSPARGLAGAFRRQRLAGKRVVAISDTALPGSAVQDLLTHVHGAAVVDAVYSSADLRQTKRGGELFGTVLQVEAVPAGSVVHAGDDPEADVTSAVAAGLKPFHAARPAWRGRLRKLNGAITEFRRAWRRRPRKPGAPYYDKASFGRVILGPVAVHFAQQIWLYATEAGGQQESVILFCARGGIGIREVFERTCAKLELPLNVRRENLMISRLVAARAAIMARDPVAAEEIQREFKGQSYADVAAALGGGTYDLPAEWNVPFEGAAFLALLFGPSGKPVLADIARQNELFTEHFRSLAGSAGRIILCDTGLYGSTQRLLAAGFPDWPIETIHFARANYKGHGEEHFPKVAGLLVERNGYSPVEVRSCILRYWQLVEALYEPALPSVRRFHRAASGDVAGNCGDIRYREAAGRNSNPLLQGALDYVDMLKTGDGLRTLADADLAWSRLKRAVTSPSATDVACLDLGARSVDFGREGSVDVMQREAREGYFQRLKRVKDQLWREGWISRHFPVTRRLLLPALGSVQAVRGLMNRDRRRPGQGNGAA